MFGYCKNYLIKWGWLIALILISIFAIQFKSHTNKSPLTQLKCPDTYKTSEERVAAFSVFVDEFYNRNPDASIAELSEAREQFYISNGCTKDLEEYYQYLNWSD